MVGKLSVPLSEIEMIKLLDRLIREAEGQSIDVGLGGDFFFARENGF